MVKHLTWPQIQALSVDDFRKAVRIDRFENGLTYRELMKKYHQNASQIKEILGGGGAKATGKGAQTYSSVELFSFLKDQLDNATWNIFYELLYDLRPEDRREAQIEVVGALAKLGWRADRNLERCMDGKLDFSFIMWTEDPSLRQRFENEEKTTDNQGETDSVPLVEYNALKTRFDELESELTKILQAVYTYFGAG